MENLQAEITELIKNKLKGKFPFNVSKHKFSFGDDEYLQIWFACSDKDINNVQGQKPQVVSLCLILKTLELKPQTFGGNGGRCIYRQPNLDDPNERYLAMKSVKLPFRTPTPTVAKVKEGISKFIDNYSKTLKENRATIRYQEMVNYDELLKDM